MNQQKQSMAVVVSDGIHYLSGDIDEYADFSSLLKASEPLRLNLKGINRLNSIGVRHFLTFIRDWGQSKRISFVECPPVFLDQLSMVPDLLGIGKRHVKIESFYVTFYCDSCDLELDERVEMSELKSKQLKLKEKNCDQCGDVLEPEITQEFLQFLSD